MTEISSGVQIIIERCKTNPEEMREEYGKWAGVRNAVFDTVEGNQRHSPWLRGLTKKEIDALYEAFSLLYRDVFDTFVMKAILDDEEEQKQAAIKGQQHAYTQALAQSMHQTKNAMAQGILNVAGGGSGATQPGGIGYYDPSQTARSQTTVTTSTSPLSSAKRLLGIK